jgi:multidrug resistance efflux pump
MALFNDKLELEHNELGLDSYNQIYEIEKTSRVKYWVYGIFTVMIICIFLPWTQNIRTRGTVTTLLQEQRPQQLNSIIPGKVVKWYFNEGDYVQAGDTILQISEIKDDYLDPNLLNRTQDQVNAKTNAVSGYDNKIISLKEQISALREVQSLKIQELENKINQQRMKIISDSLDLEASKNDLQIKTVQFQRQRVLYDSGLVSLVQLETRNQAVQDVIAKKTTAEIKYGNARQELLRLHLELNGERQNYFEKIAKAESEIFQSLSLQSSSEADLAKLKNLYSNYDIRSGMYYIKAPQSGQITKAKKAGIGEILKDNEMIVEIVPDSIQYAVEMYIMPVDLPLVSKGQKVRFMFDGFPTIVFSGWPKASYGTFGGIITAVENSVSDNGKFRVLVKEDKEDKLWPKELRIGTGVMGIALLKNVPVWYELWRNINGFPPEYYQPQQVAKKGNSK